MTLIQPERDSRRLLRIDLAALAVGGSLELAHRAVREAGELGLEPHRREGAHAGVVHCSSH
jgi:hypothetical protein